MINALDLIVPVLAMVMITGCYAPQIIKLLKTKNADSQSKAFWVMLTVALASNVYLAYRSNSTGMLVIQIANTLLAVWVLILVYKYQTTEENK